MEEIDILCINCENLISSKLISSHSHQCITPTDTASTDPNTLAAANIKLEKLILSITSHMASITLQRTYKQLLSNIIETAILAKEITVDQYNATLEFIKITHRLESTLDNNIPLTALVYVDRLKFLAEEKALIIMQEFHKKYAGMEPTVGGVTRDEDLTVTNRDVCSNDINKCRKFDVNEIDSVVDAVSRRSLSLMSNEVFEKMELELEPLEENEEENQSDGLQQHFYSQCLLMKLEFPSTHPVQDINIRKLYQESVRRNVGIDEWTEFIKEKFI